MAQTKMMNVNSIFCGDCFSGFAQMDSKIVDLTICSPPYFKQRDYCGSSDSQIGREDNLEEYIGNLLRVFKECVRVTKDTGSIVFNLGDKYMDGNLLLIPFRFAIAVEQSKSNVKLINNITWIKKNPTPRQYNRRMVSATEPFFHFVKSNDKGKLFPYKYQINTICENAKHVVSPNSKIGSGYFELISNSSLTEEQKNMAFVELKETIEKVKSGKLASLRMKIKDIHAPAFGGQEGGRKTQIEKKGYTIIEVPGNSMVMDYYECPVGAIKGIKHTAIYPQKIIEKFVELTTDEDDLVLDPFMGSGTTAISAKRLKRNYIGFELCQEYVDLSNRRLQDEQV
jgi:DNA modification methylase